MTAAVEYAPAPKAIRARRPTMVRHVRAIADRERDIKALSIRSPQNPRRRRMGTVTKARWDQMAEGKIPREKTTAKRTVERLALRLSGSELRAVKARKKTDSAMASMGMP